MSFSCRIKFADGTGTVENLTGTPPAAPLSIALSGHNDEQWVSVSAAIIEDKGGIQIIGASATGRAS